MTYGYRKFEQYDAQMRVLIQNLNNLMQVEKDEDCDGQRMIPMIDKDTNAFNAYMEAMRMPKKTEEEIAAREAAMMEGLKTAIKVPFEGMETAAKAWEFMIEMAKIGKIASKSDLQVGAKCLETGIWGCYQNVLINLKDIKDEVYVQEMKEKSEAIVKKSQECLKEVLDILESRQ